MKRGSLQRGNWCKDERPHIARHREQSLKP